MAATIIISIVAPPEALKLGDGDDAEQMRFIDFIRWSLATHPLFNQEVNGCRSALRIEAEVKKVEAGSDRLAIELDDFNRLRKAVESPHGGYPIRPALRMMPFVDAVCEARAVSLEQKEK
jgi:hypothetical protein